MDQTKIDLTICIPTSNSATTLKLILKSLTYQEINPNVLIYDNDSKDGTAEMVEAMLKNKFFSLMNLKLSKAIKLQGNRFFNIPFMRYKICQEINTKYLMFLDSDVLIPPNSIKPLLKEFQSDEKNGMVVPQESITYEKYLNYLEAHKALANIKILAEDALTQRIKNLNDRRKANLDKLYKVYQNEV